MKRLRPFALLLTSILAVFGCGDTDQPRWNVLVITLDTTRADRLGPYGHENAGTPSYDQLAAEGYVFERASTAVPVTLPSHSTIFTGTYPPVHGVRDNSIFHLPEERVTLAEILRDHGWDTGAVVASIPVTRPFGIAQGFDFFDDHVTIGAEDLRGIRIDQASNLFFAERSAPRVNDAILPWLRRDRDRPFFAWIHYWDAHQPLIAPPPFSELWGHDPYQAEIAYADHHFGIVVDALRSLGEWERTLVVLTADHGEGRGEHREETHSILAYESTLHVPLIVKVPGYTGGGRVGRHVGTVDIVPTVLDLLGLGAPDEVQGRSLKRFMENPRLGAAEHGERDVYYAETLTPRMSFGWGELRVLYRGHQKYIHGPRPELFDLARDPNELDELTVANPELADSRRRDLESQLERLSSDASAAAVRELDLETRQRLEALGYIASSAETAQEIREELRSDGAAPQDRVFDNSLVSAAKSHLGQGNWRLALEAAEQLVELDPENAFYRSMKAQALIGLDRTGDAAATIESLESIGATDDGIVLNVVRLLYSDGDTERAHALLAWLLDQRNSAAGRYLLGEMLQDEGDAVGALDQLRRAVELDPTYAHGRSALAVRLAERGDAAEAAEQFEALLRHHPMIAKYRFNYAVFLIEQGQIEAAERQLRRSVELAPWYWTAHWALLTLYVEVGDTEAADALYRDLAGRANDPAVLEQADRILEGLGPEEAP